MKNFTTIRATMLVLLVLLFQAAFSQNSENQTFAWTGRVSTDWFNASNWDSYSVPSIEDNVVIPENERLPVISGFTAHARDLTIQSGASVTLNANSTIQISGNVINNGTLNAVYATVEFNGSEAQTIAENLFYTNKVKNLIINNNVSLSGTDTITGSLSVGSGKTFTTNDYLVLKSDQYGTASIASLPTDVSGNSLAFIKGVVTIQRFIPARKAWRFLGVPVKASTAPSINSTFQEGATYSSSFAPNPAPGYGVLIAGGSTQYGFDPSPTNLPSMKYYDNATNTFMGLPGVPGTFASIASKPAYMVYIRGDRSVDFMQGTNAAITSTTLQYRGEVITGKQSVPVNATNFTPFSNPYAATIDFGALQKNNVKNTFFAWDPKLAGLYGLGGYVTVSWNSGTSTYDVTTNASGITRYIPSGAAVFVQSLNGTSAGTLIVREAYKSENGIDSLFGRPTPSASAGSSLRVNLYEIHTDGTTAILDGTLTTFHKVHSNLIDEDDVKKIYGSGESIGFRREGGVYAIERRKAIEENDTCFINISQMKRVTYRMEIVAENFASQGLNAIVLDNYSGATNNLPLTIDGTTYFDFTVNTDPRSYAVDRFKIIFSKKVISTPASETAGKGTGAQQPTTEIAKAADMQTTAVVFPNPVTTNDISIKLNNTDAGIYTLKLFNINGQMISNKQMNYSSKGQILTMKIDNGFVPGKYELKIEGQGKTMVSSIIKQ